MSHRTYRLPIHHDDGRFRDQTDRMFRDMQLRMHQDFPGHQWPSSDMWPAEEPSFFHLNPRSVPIQTVGPSERGSREALDDLTSDSLFLEDPQTKSRMFRMSFDVRKYDPSEVRVWVENRDLIVEAKQTKQGATSEFSRKIQLPDEVEAEKLTSTLSSDGVLTLQAPCPPNYHSLTSGQQSFSRGPPPQASLPSQHVSTQLESTPARGSPISVQQMMMSPPQSVTMTSPPQHVTQPPARGSPVVISVMPSTPASIPSDTPVFTTIEGGRRRLDLIIDFGRQYDAKDVVVKLDGRKMIVEATREEKQQGRVCKSSVQREFDLSEDIDPTTVQALMRADGHLAIVATSATRR